MGLPGKPIDDGQTLLYLLGRSDIDLMGITTSFGNGSINEVFSATGTLLHDLGREDIPLLKGEGERGQPPTDAARYLAETAASHPGAITLLAIGPVGNLRAAAELDPDFFSHLKQIVCMGGYLHALDLPGWDDVPELNLASDPEAAFVVLNAPCPFTLMNAHICLQAPFGLPELAPIEGIDPEAYRIQRDYLLYIEDRHLAPRDYLWDLLPAVYISYPELFNHRRLGDGHDRHRGRGGWRLDQYAHPHPGRRPVLRNPLRCLGPSATDPNVIWTKMTCWHASPGSITSKT